MSDSFGIPLAERARVDRLRLLAEARRDFDARALAAHEARQERFAGIEERLRDRADALTSALLDLHSRNTDDECEGCDYSGWEGDPPMWPCRTIDLLCEHHGIEIPK